MTRQNTNLYVISPPSIELESFSEKLNHAFEGGEISAFQLRLKNTDDDFILRAAEKLIPVCHQNNCMFIMNDRPDLAAKSGADGIHIGNDDGSIENARKIIGKNKIIGTSCYDNQDYAIEAGEKGADYIAFGAFYPTTTKETKSKPSPDILKWWSTNSVIPCVAIGGINADNCSILVEHGADFIAVISAVWNDAEGSKKAVEKLHRAIKKA